MPKRGEMTKTILEDGSKRTIFSTLNILTALKEPKRNNIICTMDDVRGDYLWPPHRTKPAAVIAHKI